MAIDQPYSRAPITEAIIDLRVEPDERLSLTQLENCHENEKEAYPNKANLNRTIGQLTVGESSPHWATTEQIGFLFKSADEKQMFQVHREGFTVNRLAPYQGWEALRDEARRLWKIYREGTQPRRVTRIAVRYLNRFDLPGTGIDLKDYLKTSPEVSPHLPQQLTGFLMQLVIPQPEIKATVLLSETAVPPPAAETSSIVLDIDLYRTEELPTEEAALWGLFEELRHRKNEIFEACITAKTRELIS